MPSASARDAEVSPLEPLETSELQPGGAYLPPSLTEDTAVWTTYYPMDEHGCKWHVRGAQGDSTGRVHGSPPIGRVAASVDA